MKETTPLRYRCATDFALQRSDLGEGKVLIIGKKVDAQLWDDISERVGDDEYAVVVEAAMLENVRVLSSFPITPISQSLPGWRRCALAPLDKLTCL